MKSINAFLLFILGALFFVNTGCSEEDVPVNNTPTPNLKTIQIRFVPTFGDQPLIPDQRYVNSAGDTIRFTTLKFYASEFALIDTTGTEVPIEGLDLVDLADPSVETNGYYSLDIKGEPGIYRGIKFCVGVPFNQNHRDVSTQVEPLGPNSGMYWSWNPGYIFSKVEGRVDSMGMSRAFLYHIGEDNRRKTIRLASLSGTPTRFEVADNEENVFTVVVDYSKFFEVGLDPKVPMQVKMDLDERTHHVGPKALADRTATNFAEMFRSDN